jgi:hypothetical protein
MTIHLMTAEHYATPGLVVRVCATRVKAVAEALACVNIMLADMRKYSVDWPAVDTEAAMEAAIERLQDYHGAEHCYADISEHEVLS